MAIELVTGKKGTVHVDSADDGALYAAIAGKGEYVLDLDDRLACTMTTANKAHVASGHGLMQGRHWLIDAEGVDLTIQNGTQGQKRNDLIVARYECDAKNGNIESVALKVIKGTPTTGTPADPACTRGDILEGAALVNEQPLWRIPLNGITVGTPIQLFDVLTPVKEAWDSVAPAALDVSTGAGWASGAGRFHRIGRLVVGSLWSVLGADRYAYAGLPRPAADGPVCIFISDKTRMAILCTVDEQGRLDMEIPMRFGEAGCIFVCYVSA